MAGEMIRIRMFCMFYTALGIVCCSATRRMRTSKCTQNAFPLTRNIVEMNVIARCFSSIFQLNLFFLEIFNQYGFSGILAFRTQHWPHTLSYFQQFFSLANICSQQCHSLHTPNNCEICLSAQ